MITYVETDGCLTILRKVQAVSIPHAVEKIQAIHGVCPAPGCVMSLAEFKAERDAALEPIGLAPWQKRLTRQESKNRSQLI